MIVFSSATAGSNRIDFEKRVVRMSHGRIKIINLIDEIVREANKTNPYISPGNLPNLDIEKIKHLKDDAVNSIIRRTNNKKNDYIIDGRMSFWWRGGPIALLTLEDIKRINPDFLISMVSNPNDVVTNLKSKPTWQEKNIDGYEMAEWSEVEIYTADLISKSIRRKNYVIGTKENPSTLYDLIYSQHKPKAYISFSMAHKKRDYKKLDSFLRKIRKYLIIFDPRSVPVTQYKYKTDRLREIVYNQTVRRDLHLIDQSDLVIIYLAELVYSSGVDSERMHAYSTGRETLLYFPFEKYSPFTPYFVDKMFNNEKDLIKEIKNLSEKFREKGKL
ncbi:MAG: ATP-binding protein [Candidatus Parvarchaeota archaeon]|nr:ATP-binding protein [Candidatus Parvarchaeota archaeon]